MGVAVAKVMVKTELEDLKRALEKKNPQDLAKQLTEELKLLNSTTLNIAITGMTGSGKSSLVNALRGMKDSEEGAAKVGPIETTMDSKRYPHPNFDNVAMWDLPGIGTQNFQAKRYLKQINFAQYDFFIIVAGVRFTENDVLLAKEIQKMKKNYYFVRSHIDTSIEADKRTKESNFNEEETLKTIREYCCKNLREAGEQNPRVFLLSSWHWGAYDFLHFQNTLASELDGLKRQILIESMPAFSKEALENKKAAMEAYIWKVAFVSCAIGIIPVPGLSLVADISILVTTMVKFCQVFGLNEKSLGGLAKRVDKPVDELKSAIKKAPLASQINQEFVLDLAAKSTLCGALMAVEFVLDFIPVLGSIVGGGSSFVTTFYILKSFLSDVEEDAKNVRAKVVELQAK